MRRLLKQELKIQIPHILIQRIETGSVGIGVPDFYFKTIYNGGWIELKEIKGNVSRETIIKIPFQPGQFNWIKRYISLNGNMILICSIDKIWHCFKGDYIREEYVWEDFHIYGQEYGEVTTINFQRLLQNSFI